MGSHFSSHPHINPPPHTHRLSRIFLWVFKSMHTRNLPVCCCFAEFSVWAFKYYVGRRGFNNVFWRECVYVGELCFCSRLSRKILGERTKNFFLCSMPLLPNFLDVVSTLPLDGTHWKTLGIWPLWLP